MRAKDFVIEATGTFYHGTRSEFDFEQLGAGKGMQSFDRILGPHFAKAPEIASRFAMYDPQSVYKQRASLSGGRIFPVSIPGEIYVLPQPRGMIDMQAVATDAFMKIVLPNKELLGLYLDVAAKSEYQRMLDMHMLSAEAKAEDPAAVTQRLSIHLQQMLEQKRYEVVIGPLFKINFNQDFLVQLATQYKQSLMNQGYGLIQYKNTNSKETKDIADKNSYIALAKPESIFAGKR